MWPNLRSGIFKNLGLKLLSVLLACIVFAHVVTEKEREVEMLVPLRLTKIPAGMAYVGHCPRDILIRARGTGKQLLWLKLFSVQARVNVSDAVVGHYQRAFTPSDVSLPPGSGVEVVEVVEPRSLSLDFDKEVSRRVKVFANVVGIPASGYAVGGSPIVKPDSVRVTGARKVVDEIDLVHTGPVDVANVREPAIEKVAIETRDLNVGVDPSEVVVDVPVEKLAQHRFDQVPVEILRSSEITRVASDPGSGSVVILGPESQLHALVTADIHLRIDARNLRAGRYVMLPRVELAGELSAISIEPEKFLVTLE